MNQKQKNEIVKCKKSFTYFLNYLKIVDKNGRLVTFKPNGAQHLISSTLTLKKWVCILKARQLGSSTFIAAYFFWKTLFKLNERTIVVAHTHESVKSIFSIYRTFYDNLPEFLKFKTIASSVNELRFVTGSFIKVGSATSESFRGSTYQNIHASECAFWKDITTTIAALFQTASDNSTIILETTANGLNGFQKFWLDENGFNKLFIGWQEDERYVLKEKPKVINETIKEYGDIHGLTDEQLNWAAQTFDVKCASNIKVFNQEYPINANLAFLASGDRVFTCSFRLEDIETGLKLYEKPEQYSVYTIGIDTASGSREGDYSAFVVLNITDKKKPTIAATYYERMPPTLYAEIALKLAKKFGALAVIESNSYGLSIIEHFVDKEYVLQYRRTKYDKIGNKWSESMGFSTNVATRPLMISRLQEYISKKWLQPIDKRLQQELNTFVYNKKGKPIADTGKHDDMIFATALALMGLDQINQVEAVKKNRKPANLLEIMEFESKTGQLYKNVAHLFDPDPLEEGKEAADDIKNALHKV